MFREAYFRAIIIALYFYSSTFKLWKLPIDHNVSVDVFVKDFQRAFEKHAL